MQTAVALSAARYGDLFVRYRSNLLMRGPAGSTRGKSDCSCLAVLFQMTAVPANVVQRETSAAL